MNVLAVVAYIVVVATVGAVQHFFPSFHKFKSTEAVTSVGRAPAEAGAPLVVHGGDGR
jgi:glycerol-3-phosphate acyltransferase PlsY